MKYLKLTTAMLAALSLSACFGSNNDKTADAPVVEPPVPATFAEKEASGLAILDTIDEKVASDELTSSFDLPTTGSANYTGYMALPDPTGPGYLAGTGDMDVDFANFDVDGTVGNFTNSMDEAWSGNLSFTGNFGVAVEVDGTLTSEAGVDTVIDAEAELINHTNYGSTAGGEQTPEYYTGNLIGTATTGTEKPVLLDDTNTAYIGELTN